jgi:hypothetical protein
MIPRLDRGRSGLEVSGPFAGTDLGADIDDRGWDGGG